MKLYIFDYIMIIAFLLMVSNHGITQFLIAKHTSIETTQEEANNLIKYVEANPIAAKILLIKKFQLVYSTIIAPAIFLGFYYYIRKKYINNHEVLMMFSIIMGSAFFLNFVNDFSYLLGFLFK